MNIAYAGFTKLPSFRVLHDAVCTESVNIIMAMVDLSQQ